MGCLGRDVHIDANNALAWDGIVGPGKTCHYARAWGQLCQSGCGGD